MTSLRTVYNLTFENNIFFSKISYFLQLFLSSNDRFNQIYTLKYEEYGKSRQKKR